MSKQYGEYKDSGIEWLGEIPSHWGISFLKHTADFVNGAAFKPESWQDEGIPIVRIQNLNGSQDFNYVDPSLEVNRNCYLSGGELLFSWSGNIGTSFGPFFWQEGREAYLNQHIFKVTNYELHTRYFYWLLRAVTKYIESKTHGIIGMVHITKKELGGIPIPKISYEEQEAIGDYIDYKTGQIDKLIAQKEELMNLLQKMRQAIINEAVTQGLNPNAPRRDSGIEWLGEIPAHWDVKKLKYVATINPGKDSELYEESVTFLPMEKVGETGEVDYTLRRPIDEVSTGFTYFEKDDVIVAKITPCFENGKGAHLRDMETNVGFGSTEFHVLRTNDLIDPAYLYLITTSDRFRNLGEASMTGSAGQKRVPTSFIENFVIPLPPLEEQLQIREAIDHKKDLTSTSLIALADQIKKLKLYRQSIINEVVTGKVDVREVVLNEV